jgi:hypothetical protein
MHSLQGRGMEVLAYCCQLFAYDGWAQVMLSAGGRETSSLIVFACDSDVGAEGL